MSRHRADFRGILWVLNPNYVVGPLSLACDDMDENRLSRELASYYPALVADLKRVALRDRWGLGLMAIGWIHLAFFTINQYFYVPNDSHAMISVSLWVAEILSVWFAFRLICGKGWSRQTPLAGILFKVWMTFLILAFNAALQNSLTGWSSDWFKLSWMTLSSFGFATMAWVLSPWYLVIAVEMSLTGMLMYRFPQWAYVFHGISWWLALHGIGIILERMRVPAPRVVRSMEYAGRHATVFEVPIAHS